MAKHFLMEAQNLNIIVGQGPKANTGYIILRYQTDCLPVQIVTLPTTLRLHWFDHLISQRSKAVIHIIRQAKQNSMVDQLYKIIVFCEKSCIKR